MSGTFRIADDVVWMPSAWAFDAILDWIANEVAPHDGALADDLRAGSATVTGYGFVEVEDLPEERFRGLVAAAESVLDRLLLGPLDTVGGPDYFQGLSSALILLVALLRADGRNDQGEHRHGEILLPHGEDWTAPEWVHDLVVEHLAADAAVAGRDAVPVLTGRVRRGTGVLDLRLSPEAFRDRVLPTLRRLVTDYGDGIRGLGRAPDEPMLAAAVLLLAQQAGLDVDRAE
jgi:hypothetical protein